MNNFFMGFFSEDSAFFTLLMSLIKVDEFCVGLYFSLLTSSAPKVQVLLLYHTLSLASENPAQASCIRPHPTVEGHFGFKRKLPQALATNFSNVRLDFSPQNTHMVSKSRVVGPLLTSSVLLFDLLWKAESKFAFCLLFSSTLTT